MFPSIKNISFFKFSALVLKPGTYVAIQKLKEKLSIDNLFFKDFLNCKKHELFHVYKPKQCCLCDPQADTRHSGKGLDKVQWKQLFTQTKQRCNSRRNNCCCMFSAQPNVQEDFLDITLAVCLLINMFPLCYQEKRALEELRKQRNFYAHNFTSEIEDKDYVDRLPMLISSITTIAESLNSQIQEKISEDIREIMNNSLNCVCHQRIIELCSEDRIKQLEKFEEVTNKVLQKFEEFQKAPENEQVISEDQGEFENQRAEKLRKKLKEIKFHSVHGFQTPRISSSTSCETMPLKLGNKPRKRPSVRENIERMDSLPPAKRNISSRILQLCKTGTLQEMEQEIEKVTDKGQVFRAKDKNGYSGIHHVAERSDKEALKILQVMLNHGADLSEQTSESMTILHIACKKGNIALSDYCLKKDPDLLNLEDFNGWNAAMFAVFYGHMSSLNFLRGFKNLKICSDKTKVNILHLACLNRDINIFKKIFEKFPDLKRDTDQEGRTILHYVARGGSYEILSILFKDRWMVNQLKSNSAKLASPLEIACLYGHAEMCRNLIAKHPTMMRTRNKNGLHAVQYAAIGGHIDVMCLLQEFLGNTIEKYIKFGEKGNDVLQLACMYGKNEMWKYISNKFPTLLSKRDHDGWGMQHLAARFGNCSVLKMVLEPEEAFDDNQQPFKWNEKDSLHRTVLHIASLHGNLEVCTYLVSKFPQINEQRDIYGCLACTLAAKGGNFNLFRLLYDKASHFIDEIDMNNILEAAHQSNNSHMIHCIMETYETLRLKENEKYIERDEADIDVHIDVHLVPSPEGVHETQF